jgi:hypothetical protein
MTAVNSSFWTGIIKKSSGSLDAVDRINEVNFGLIMVLTFTCSINAATEGHEEVRTVLWAALSCNVAWGIIDSFIYLFSVMMYRGESLDIINNIRRTKNESEANKMIEDALPPLLADLVEKDHIDQLRKKILLLAATSTQSITDVDRCVGCRKNFPACLWVDFPGSNSFHFCKRYFPRHQGIQWHCIAAAIHHRLLLWKNNAPQPVAHGLMLSGIGALLVAMTIALGG